MNISRRQMLILLPAAAIAWKSRPGRHARGVPQLQNDRALVGHAHRHPQVHWLRQLCPCLRQAENDVPDGFFRTWVERYHVTDWNLDNPQVISPDGGKEGFPSVHRRRDGKVFLRSQNVQPLRRFALHPGLPRRRHFCQPGRRGPGRPDILPGLRLLRPGLPLRLPLHPSPKKVADKCTLCYHRITKGLTTACCENCPTGARQLADLKNPKDPIHAFLKTHNVQMLKPKWPPAPRSSTTNWMVQCAERRCEAHGCSEGDHGNYDDRC